MHKTFILHNLTEFNTSVKPVNKNVSLERVIYELLYPQNVKHWSKLPCYIYSNVAYMLWILLAMEWQFAIISNSEDIKMNFNPYLMDGLIKM
jgi:hypothetical protein